MVRAGSAEKRPVEVLYDGGCGRCRRSVSWAAARTDTGVSYVDTVTLDATALAARGLNQEAIGTSVWLVEADRPPVGGARAVGALLTRCPKLWPLAGRLLRSRAVLPVAEPLYHAVAARRHRDQCSVPVSSRDVSTIA